MTISYSLSVSKATFGGFAKLLFRWKGSIFKSLWRESLLFCTLYVLINATYRHAMDQKLQSDFAQIINFAKYFMDVIPFYFIVGFYVSTVTGRWIDQYRNVPWPDNAALLVSSIVHGSDERSRMIRRTLARYIVLLQVLTFQLVSTAVRRRFPTTQHLVQAGIMTAEERSVYEKVDFRFGKWWLPGFWFINLATRAKKECRIKDSLSLSYLYKEMLNLREKCAIMIGFDWIGVPLAYTQVATIATYLYALVLLVGTQSIETPKDLTGFTMDYYFPFFTIWRFFFSVGWLKVAEQLLNPYGEDDDDFELNWCLDRSVTLVYNVVDDQHMMHPKVKKDAFWDVQDVKLPQTIHSAKYMKNPELGSANGLEIEETDYLPLDELCEKDDEENLYRSESMKKKAAGRQNSSFIRRIWNSGFAQSLRRKPRKMTARRVVSCNQGTSNNAFYMGDESDDTASMPSCLRKSSQINLVKNEMNNGSSARLQSKSFGRNKAKTYQTEETEIKYSTSDNAHQESGNQKTNTKNPPTVQPPSSVTFDIDSGKSRDESRDDFENKPGDQDLDVFMPSIPEEASRANSLLSTEQIYTISRDKESSQMYDCSHDLAAEINEELTEYRDTFSGEEKGKENEARGYESCCSSSEDLSDNSLDEKIAQSERIMQTKKIEHRDQDETVCITIDTHRSKNGSSGSHEFTKV